MLGKKTVLSVRPFPWQGQTYSIYRATTPQKNEQSDPLLRQPAEDLPSNAKVLVVYAKLSLLGTHHFILTPTITLQHLGDKLKGRLKGHPHGANLIDNFKDIN